MTDKKIEKAEGIPSQSSNLSIRCADGELAAKGFFETQFVQYLQNRKWNEGFGTRTPPTVLCRLTSALASDHTSVEVIGYQDCVLLSNIILRDEHDRTQEGKQESCHSHF